MIGTTKVLLHLKFLTKKKVNNMKSMCENCANYVYDDESDCYYCESRLDEDEMHKFLTSRTENCPYFNFYDEYSIVRKQN